MHSPVQNQTRRAVSAAVIGNVLEWYDFSVYAFVAVIIARKFFPQGNDVIALLATFLAFGLGFVARPLGGIVLGRLGDTHGRIEWHGSGDPVQFERLRRLLMSTEPPTA